jgi:hypothetical protein
MPDKLKTIEGSPTSTVVLQRISPHAIHDDGENPRKNPADIRANVDRLKLSMQVHGFLIEHAISVYEKEKKYYRQNGQCRHLAALELMAEGVWPAETRLPVIVKTGQGSPADRQMAMLVAQETRNLDPLDLAHGYKRLESLGLSIEQIARGVTHSPSHVRDILAFLDAEPQTLTPFRDGELTQRQVVQIVRDASNFGTPQAVLVEQAKAARRADKALQATAKAMAKATDVPDTQKVLVQLAKLEERYGVDTVRQATRQYLGLVPKASGAMEETR